ncbi:hypothetical protein ACQKKK_24955 [Peribacillus sp. NPDC006672]|uniref:hypothetical protein n=1 Tax=Peribacillus sp. NPDC006672 TaxID=3390606 RepID=UPI003D0708A0
MKKDWKSLSTKSKFSDHLTGVIGNTYGKLAKFTFPVAAKHPVKNVCFILNDEEGSILGGVTGTMKINSITYCLIKIFICYVIENL